MQNSLLGVVMDENLWNTTKLHAYLDQDFNKLLCEFFPRVKWMDSDWKEVEIFNFFTTFLLKN